MEIFFVGVVYRSCKYMECVGSCADTSMRLAVETVKALPDYVQAGEVQFTFSVFTCTYN